MRLSSSQRAALVLAAAMFAAAGPGRADWLVVKDGSRIETRGTWQVKAKQVVFTQNDGRLSALRLVDVDLDASAKATTDARNVPEAAAEIPAAKKKPILVLTDKDVGHVDTATAAPATEAGKDDAKKEAEAAVGAVQVLSWEKAPTADGGGIEIFGSLKNTGSDTATDIEVLTKLYDQDGALLGTANATISASALPPNGVTNFRASFPGILGFQTAKFQIQSRGIVTKGAEAPPAASTPAR
jgi:hypothetical protein